MTDLYACQGWLGNRSYHEIFAMKAAILKAWERGISALHFTMNMGALSAEIARRSRL